MNSKRQTERERERERDLNLNLNLVYSLLTMDTMLRGTYMPKESWDPGILENFWLSSRWRDGVSNYKWHLAARKCTSRQNNSKYQGVGTLVRTTVRNEEKNKVRKKETTRRPNKFRVAGRYSFSLCPFSGWNTSYQWQGTGLGVNHRVNQHSPGTGKGKYPLQYIMLYIDNLTFSPKLITEAIFLSWLPI